MSTSSLSPTNRLPAAVIFIIGPWAATWFSARLQEPEETQVRWIVAPEAETMQKDLQKLRLKNRGIRAITFLPFFPDAEETAEQALAQLTTWQRQFRLTESLPCVLGLYARLSLENIAGQTKWSGKLDLSGKGETTLENELEKLLATPETGFHSIYRYAMTDALRLWLWETGIAKSLHAQFSTSSLRLAAVLLADCGHGFTRHGAWAKWLRQKFGLCPGLAPTLILPELPATTIYSAPVLPVAKKRPRRLAVFIVLLLAFCLVISTWIEARYLTAATRNLAAFQQIDLLQPQTKWKLYQSLNEQKQQLLHCHDAFFSRFWGFTHCEKLAGKLSQTLQEYDLSSIFMPSGSLALFDQGSATLRPGSDKSLSVLLPLIRDDDQIRFMVVGHSDNTGSTESNYQLSLRRARAVRDWLVSHANISPERFSLQGMGDSKPVASNQTAEGREKNRRVEIIPLLDSHS